VAHAAQSATNRKVLESWLAKWAPLGDRAIDAYCAGLGDDGAAARQEARTFRSSLG
jgi:toluene monooxygenase system protein E